MRLSQNTTIILVTLLCTSVSNILNAGILWEKDLVFGDNTNSSPLSSCINNNANGVFVITKVGPKGFFLHKSGDSVLWEIGVDGNIVRKNLLKDADGNAMKTDALAVGPGCAMVADRSGNLLTIGVLDERKKGKSLSFVSTANTTEANIIAYKQVEDFSIKELISLQDETFASVGNRSGDGVCLRIDNQGSIVQENLFDLGNNEIFSGVTRIKSENLSLAVVGVSVRISTKDPNENSAENFILIYDSKDKIAHEDYFTGEIPGLLFPKVCCLDNGNIIVVYKKKSEHSKTVLWARCYTKELKFLWEKEVFSTDKSFFSFDVISCDPKGFLVAFIIPIEGLEAYFFNDDGQKTGYTQYKGMVGTPGFNIMRMNGQTIAVFEEGTAGNIKECTIKAKVIALD